jgi:hypothetical protein
MSAPIAFNVLWTNSGHGTSDINSLRKATLMDNLIRWILNKIAERIVQAVTVSLSGPELRALQQQLAAAQIQMPPPTNRTVVAGGVGVSAWALQSPGSAPQRDDHSLGGELDPRHPRPRDRQYPVECG